MHKGKLRGLLQGCSLAIFFFGKNCQVEPSLKWHKQVEELLKKLKKRLTALENLRFIIPFQLRKTITEGIFTSVLAYCLPVFGGCDKFEIESP